MHANQRAPDGAPLHYERHRPEQITLYRLLHQYAANFIAHAEARRAPSFGPSRTSSTRSSSAASWPTAS